MVKTVGFRSVLKINSKECFDGLDVMCEEKQDVEDDSEDLGLGRWE